MAEKKSTNDKKQTTKKKPAPSKKKAPAYIPNILSRTIGGSACLFVTVMLLLGLFGVRAVVIDLLCNAVKGLVGYGFWVTPLVLVGISFLLFARRGGSVCLRIWSFAVLPLLMGAFSHLLFSPYGYSAGFSIVPKLWADGIALFSGGVLGGLLSISFATLFSKIGASVIFILLMLPCLAIAFHLTPGQMLSFFRNRRARRQAYYDDYDNDDGGYDEYDSYGDDPYDDRYDAPPMPEPMPQRRDFRLPSLSRRKDRKRRVRDLPLDDFPEVTEDAYPSPVQTEKTNDLHEVFGGEKRSFFNPKAEVKRPDEALSELIQEDTQENTAAPVSVAVPPVYDSPKDETKAEKKEAIRREASEVTQTVEKTLEETPQEYAYPPLDLLTPPTGVGARAAHEELEGTLERLSSILSSFGIDGHVEGAVQGPSVTRYEIGLEQGVRLNKLTNLSDDVALALGVSGVRIAPVPGKISVVGIEVPNKAVTPVPIREVLDSPAFHRHPSQVAFSVGKDIGGNYIVGDCSRLPHMLIAGTTGSGKSVCINSMIVSLLYKSTPEEVRLIMVDPKMVELGGYNGIPHLLIPVVTDPKKAAGALQWAVAEMMKRYRLFSEAGVRELTSYNEWAREQNSVQTMPKVVIVIDELADLMLVAAKEVEESICRVAQMGRAAGMHLVIATQRPSADVITGLMKANIPSRIAFAVASSLESRIILDNTGAEKLVGKGDMLWFPLGSGKPLRVQGCFISDEEVTAVVSSVKQNSTADYDDDIMEQIEQHASETDKKGKSAGFSGGDPAEEGQDEMFAPAVDVILELGQASVSMLQRRLKLGYARAARLVDQMEDKGIVGPFEGSKPRQLLITKEQWVQMQGGTPAAVPEEAPPPVEEEILTFDPVPQPFE